MPRYLNEANRVVVTGYGAVTCLGNTASEMWTNLLQGCVGISRETSFDTTGLNVSISAEVHGFDSILALGPHWAWQGGRFCQLAMAAALEALGHAGIDYDRGEASEAGVVISNAHGNLEPLTPLSYRRMQVDGGYEKMDYIQMVHDTLEYLQTRAGCCPVDRDPILRGYSDFPATILGRRLRTTGPQFTVCSACVGGAKAVERAVRYIRHGQCEMAIAGGTESLMERSGIVFLDAMRALTTGADDPETASRPFDKGRSGFVLGEGAGILILESLQHAKRRGANILAEVAGVGGSANAFSLFAPEPVGAGPNGSMRAALRNAGLEPEVIDCIFAHATATADGDAAEAEGIRMCFGDHAQEIAVSAPKSMMGHAIGASGALNAINCVQAIESGLVPPIANLTDPEEFVKDIGVVRDRPCEKPIRFALNNAFGFGGSNGTNIFARFEG